MCLITFQFHEHPRYKLILAANRDEFYGRPTAAASFWEDEPKILAGRDLLQRGTWLGVTTGGRIAALTNYRDPAHMKNGKKSRGEVVRHFLASDSPAENFLASLKKDDFNGFNLLAGSADELFYFNNIQGSVQKISPGTHGLSNAFLNTPWPKVVKGVQGLRMVSSTQNVIKPASLFSLLSSAEQAGDNELPQTGVGLELERQLSPLFIRLPEYGTRSSTIVTVDHNNLLTFTERTYENGKMAQEVQFSFPIAH